MVEVFADFLEYLLNCASRYIEESHTNGADLWNSVKNDLDFVMSHPNGWEGSEQSQMRDAAILAGLVPDTPSGRSRVSFVTEGEASLHFAIQNSVLSRGVKVIDSLLTEMYDTKFILLQTRKVTALSLWMPEVGLSM